ncbi:hypothetical protein WCT97_07595 [Pectobacterium versatile]|uniref:hypothetical protein n=1 Tax=Pectobacterium versatile TaxID=2488639 RepID=UPI003018D77A
MLKFIYFSGLKLILSHKLDRVECHRPQLQYIDECQYALDDGDIVSDRAAESVGTVVSALSSEAPTSEAENQVKAIRNNQNGK